jgi:phospholipid-binding lipoprotein MlaA
MSSTGRIFMFTCALALSGCATNNPKDPFEPFNRTMFRFNDAVDQAALKPAAQAYSNLPSVVQTGVSNFFGNLADVWTAVNNLLQGKVADGVSDVMRFAVNSTFGLGGLIDIGSQAGMVKHKKDFGQTLGTWGVGPGPYVVLPILGSSTLRDTIATPVDISGDPWHYKRPIRWRNTGSVLRAVDQRTALLGASNLLEDVALDRYEFVRDVYLQRRESKIRNDEASSAPYEDDVGPTLERNTEVERSPASADVPAGKPSAELREAVDVNQQKSSDAPGTNTTVSREAAR